MFYPPTFSATLILLSVLPSQFQPLTLSPSLFLSSFLRPSHPFHDRRSISLTILRPPFSCLSVVSSLLPRLSAHLFPPLSQSFPSFAARVGSIYSFPLPPTPKMLFSRGPFASTVIRHPSFSFLLPLFFLLTPTLGRDNLPFSLVLSYISILGSIPPAVSFSSPLAFSFPLYIHLSIFPFRSLPNQPSCLFPPLSSFFPSRLDSPVLSPCSAFYVFPTLSTRRLLASSRIFPFRGHRSRDDDQPALSPGKHKRKRPLPLFLLYPPPSPSRHSIFHISMLFRVSKREKRVESSKRLFSVVFFRSFPLSR